MSLDDNDLENLRLAIDCSRHARQRGNSPYGAVLADAGGKVVLEAENSQYGDRDCTAHAEVNLIRKATRLYDAETLAGFTLYASGEPCAMCAGAIYWSNIRRVVFALDGPLMCELTDDSDGLALDCRAVLGAGAHGVEVLGPCLQDEASVALVGFRAPGA